MNIEKRIREIKGGLLFVTFLFVGVFLYLQDNLGTMGYLQNIGVPSTFVIAGFFASAFACGYIGLKHLAWNILWYTPFCFYVGAAWLSAIDKINTPTPVPVTAPALYTLLMLFLILDWWSDWRKEYGTKPG